MFIFISHSFFIFFVCMFFENTLIKRREHGIVSHFIVKKPFLNNNILGGNFSPKKSSSIVKASLQLRRNENQDSTLWKVTILPTTNWVWTNLLSEITILPTTNYVWTKLLSRLLIWTVRQFFIHRYIGPSFSRLFHSSFSLSYTCLHDKSGWTNS